MKATYQRSNSSRLSGTSIAHYHNTTNVRIYYVHESRKFHFLLPYDSRKRIDRPGFFHSFLW